MPSTTAGRSVLVVNDQDALRQTMVRTLLARGFRARTARSGREALESVRTDKPDVILIDMDPPALEGWESARRLKADPPHPGGGPVGEHPDRLAQPRDARRV